MQNPTFVPYLKHTEAEIEPIAVVCARDPDKDGQLLEGALARRRNVQWVDAAMFLTGRLVRLDGVKVVHIDHVERSQNAASECFVLVTGAALRIPVTPSTKLEMEKHVRL